MQRLADIQGANEMTIVKTEHYYHAEAQCERCNTEHFVTGCSSLDKSKHGVLKDDLVKILREDYPECKLQPKPVHDGYRTYERAADGRCKWSDMK